MHPADRSRNAFLEFRRSRSPQALTEVFDLCAQELLLVAHHLARPGVAPEDLLQSTFLEAIRVAERYDETRPLMGWLCGILVNVARTQNRVHARAFEPELLHATPVDDPAELAYVREFTEAVAVAISEFPATQREVLTLRLVHGLTPTEIAHALGHPVGSVKSWIHRGVERLKVILPASFAASLMCVTKAELTLDAVRETLIAQACPPTKASEVSSSKSILRSPSVVAATVVATAVVLTLAASRFATSSDRESHSASRAIASEPKGDATPLAFTHSRTELSSSTPHDDQPILGSRLHASFASDGSAASIALRFEPRFGVDPALRSLTIRTDENGDAILSRLEPGEYELTPDRGAPRSVQLPFDGVLEVAIEPGALVAGVVRDGEGRALGGVGIWLGQQADWNEGQIVARTDSAGRYALRDVPFHSALAAVADDFGCTQLRHVLAAPVERPAGELETRTLDFELQRAAATVAGMVRDARGQPVADARVLIGEALAGGWDAPNFLIHSHDPPQLLITDAQGRFECRSAPAREALRVWARAVGSSVHAERIDTRDGGVHELSIALDDGVVWNGTLAADFQEPANILLIADERDLVPDEESTPRWAHPRAFVAPTGTFSLAGLVPGRAFLSADDKRGHWDLREELVARDGGVVWSPNLVGERHLHGSARTVSGEALAGYRIKLIESDGLVNGALVDAAGAFAFNDVEDRPLTLWLYPPAGVYAGPVAHAHNVRAGPERVEFVLADERQPSAFVIARVLDATREPSDRVRACAARDNTITPGVLDEQGRCHIGPLPPGSYYLTIAGEQGQDFLHGPFELRTGEELDLGELEQRPGGRVHVRIDDPDSASGANVQAALLTLDGALMPTFFVVRDGEATTLPVPPGRYAFWVADEDFGLLQREVDVREDAVTELVVRKPTTVPVEVTIDDAELCAGLCVSISMKRSGADRAVRWPLKAKRGVDGHLRLNPRLEPGSYRIEACTAFGKRGCVELDVSANGPAAKAHFELR